MSCKQKFAFKCPFIVPCGCSDETEDCACGQDSGCGCGNHGSADPELLEKILERLTKIQECVCDCGGMPPEPGYKGEAIGVILPESDRKSGTALYRVDKDIENVDSVSAEYFNKHPLWSGIVPEEIDGQAMIKVPAFAYKRGVADSGSNEGKKYLLLAPADTKEPGFERHPAFMKDGQPIDHFWVGAYQACADPADANKLGSVAGTMPVADLTFSKIHPRAYNRNVNDVTGFMMWSIYQLSALQMLCLVEIADSDVQKSIGKVSDSIKWIVPVDDPELTPASYRGIIGLWGNISEFVDGLRTDSSSRVEIWNRSGKRQYIATDIAMPGAGYIS